MKDLFQHWPDSVVFTIDVIYSVILQPRRPVTWWRKWRRRRWCWIARSVFNTELLLSLIGMKFDTIILEINMHRLTDMISTFKLSAMLSFQEKA